MTNYKRLLKIAAYLLNKNRETKFVFSEYSNHGLSGNYEKLKNKLKGTANCAAGSCPIIFPKDLDYLHGTVVPSGTTKLFSPDNPTREVLKEFLGLSDKEYNSLFMPNEYPFKYEHIKVFPLLNKHASAQEVANRIIKFVLWKQKVERIKEQIKNKKK